MKRILALLALAGTLAACDNGMANGTDGEEMMDSRPGVHTQEMQQDQDQEGPGKS